MHTRFDVASTISVPTMVPTVVRNKHKGQLYQTSVHLYSSMTIINIKLLYYIHYLVTGLYTILV